MQCKKSRDAGCWGDAKRRKDKEQMEKAVSTSKKRGITWTSLGVGGRYGLFGTKVLVWGEPGHADDIDYAVWRCAREIDEGWVSPHFWGKEKRNRSQRCNGEVGGTVVSAHTKKHEVLAMGICRAVLSTSLPEIINDAQGKKGTTISKINATKETPTWKACNMHLATF